MKSRGIRGLFFLLPEKVQKMLKTNIIQRCISHLDKHHCFRGFKNIPISTKVGRIAYFEIDHWVSISTETQTEETNADFSLKRFLLQIKIAVVSRRLFP